MRYVNMKYVCTNLEILNTNSSLFLTSYKILQLLKARHMYNSENKLQISFVSVFLAILCKRGELQL